LEKIVIRTIETSTTRRTVHNIGLAKGGLTYFVETLVQGPTFVLGMNFSAENPASLVASL